MMDADTLRQHYNALTDDALLDLKPEDLTDIARQYYQVELSNRGLTRPVPPKREETEPERPRLPGQPQFALGHLRWGSDAVRVAEFQYPEDAEQSREVLERADIPCALVHQDQDADLGYSRYRTRIDLMVPRTSLEAALERLRIEINEPTADENYSNHFVEFSDDELLDVGVEALPEAGRKWYSAEMKKRGLSPQTSVRHSDPASAALTDAEYVSVATLLEEEARVAQRFLETASIPCRVERDDAPGVFESFSILAPAAYFDQAAEILNKHQAEIFKQ